jgi:hypothetical protein
MKHRMDVRGKAFEFGLTGDAYAADHWGIAWHADYVSLGHISSECICTPIDADYAPIHHKVTGHTPGVHDADYKGHGIARGGLLSIAPYASVGKFRVGVEVGAFVSRVDWDEMAYNWMGQASTQATNNHVPAPRAWRIGEMTGLFVTRGNWRVSYQHYTLPSRYALSQPIAKRAHPQGDPQQPRSESQVILLIPERAKAITSTSLNTTAFSELQAAWRGCLLVIKRERTP